MNNQLVRDFKELFDEVEERKAEIKMKEDQLKELERLVINDLEQSELEQIGMDDGRWLRIYRIMNPVIIKDHAGDATPEERSKIIDALRESGHGDMVYETYHSGSLGKLFREMKAEAEKELDELEIPDKENWFLPEQLQEVYTVSDKVTIKITKNKVS